MCLSLTWHTDPAQEHYQEHHQVSTIIREHPDQRALLSEHCCGEHCRVRTIKRAHSSWSRLMRCPSQGQARAGLEVMCRVGRGTSPGPLHQCSVFYLLEPGVPGVLGGDLLSLSCVAVLRIETEVILAFIPSGWPPGGPTHWPHSGSRPPPTPRARPHMLPKSLQKEVMAKILVLGKT